MVGDKIETDIEMAQNAGVDSILVLTGESKEKEVDNISNVIK